MEFPLRAAAFLIATVPSAAIAAPLWQKAETGMSIAQVAALFPAAKPPVKVDTLAKGTARCELSIPTYEVASTPYKVCFYFEEAKLVQVMLKSLDPNYPRFETAVALLRSRYGPELGAGQPLCKEGLMKICEAQWSLKSGTNVSALFIQVGANEPIVNINYQVRMAAEASKL